MSEDSNTGDPSKDQELTEEQLEEKKLLADNADIIEQARAKHEEIAIFKAPSGFDGIVIIGAPTNPKTYQNYVNQLAKPETDKAVETVNFALACTFHPARDVAKAMYAKRGAFALKVSGKAQELAGSETKELGKA